PTWGSQSSTISPSVRTTTRNTPWVLGCCGPMFSSISSLRKSETCGGVVRGSAAISFSHHVVLHAVVVVRRLVVLAEGMPLPVLGATDPNEVVMALEPDPHEVPGLPLVPVGGPPDVLDAGNHRGFARHEHPHPDPVSDIADVLEVVEGLELGPAVDRRQA